MRNKVGLLLATGAGIAGGKWFFEPLILEQKEKQGVTAAMPGNNTTPPPQRAEHQSTSPLASAPTPTFFTPANPASLTPSAIANTRTLAHLPSTEISKSAHPDDAAKIMYEPLPSSPLIAKKIPSKEDSGEMQAEPYTKGPGGDGLFEKVKFW